MFRYDCVDTVSSSDEDMYCHQFATMVWFRALGVLLSILTFVSAEVERHTQMVMAQAQGCVLVVQFQIENINSGSVDVLRMKPLIAWPICENLNSMRPGFKKEPSDRDFYAIYGGLKPPRTDIPFESFPLRVIGPQEILVRNYWELYTPLEKQAFRLDGTTYL